MVRTITPVQTISTTTNEELKKRKLNPSVCEPSEETITNILNYSKAVKAVSSSNTGVIMNVMN
ncbi:MAG: hypothetical protein K0S33_3645 [Bacteroidetes bacterium]|jgi:hypothetical protein|nr:hypothetical protein [Bacteroidota bacterium]